MYRLTRKLGILVGLKIILVPLKMNMNFSGILYSQIYHFSPTKIILVPLPSGQTTLKQRLFNVDSTSVESTSI